MNKPVINEDTNVKLIRELRAEIKRLKNLLGNVDVILDPAIQERITENEAKAKVSGERARARECESARARETH